MSDYIITLSSLIFTHTGKQKITASSARLVTFISKLGFFMPPVTSA